MFTTKGMKKKKEERKKIKRQMSVETVFASAAVRAQSVLPGWRAKREGVTDTRQPPGSSFRFESYNRTRQLNKSKETPPTTTEKPLSFFLFSCMCVQTRTIRSVTIGYCRELLGSRRVIPQKRWKPLECHHEAFSSSFVFVSR